MTDNTGRQEEQKSQDSGEGTADSRPTGQPSEGKGITRVDLSKYEFSPPGPMGWTVEEYEKMIEQLQQDKGE